MLFSRVLPHLTFKRTNTFHIEICIGLDRWVIPSQRKIRGHV